MAPRRTNAIVAPSGDMARPLAAPTFVGAPPATGTRQSAISAPAGSLVGFGFSPARLGPCPRVKKIVDASLDQTRPPNSWPSACVYEVSLRPRYSGGAATQMLRTPRSFNTHATSPPLGAAVRAPGYGAAMSCSIGISRCWAKTGEADSTATTAATATWHSTRMATISRQGEEPRHNVAHG